MSELYPLTVDMLIDRLEALRKEGKGCHKVMLRFTGSDHVVLGARLMRISTDNFYQYVNLIGPNDVDVELEPNPPAPDLNRCRSKDVMPYGPVDESRYMVRQCKHSDGHTGRHSYAARLDQPTEGFRTAGEAKDWLRTH